ncbi:MAG: hypothetical protein WBN15_13125, partial [Polyangiales bacterium]
MTRITIHKAQWETFLRIEGLGLAALLLGLWWPADLASAQWDPSTQQGTSTTATTAPPPPQAPPDQMVSA